VVLGSLAAVACGDATAPTEEPVTQVVVTSPVGAVIAVGSSIQFEVTVTVDGAQTLGAVTWTSSDPAVATVSTAGSVTGIAPGSVRISASHRGTSGGIDLAVVDADLEAVAAVLEDEYFELLIAGLSPSTRAALQATVTACVAALAQQHVIDLVTCLAAARNSLGSPANVDETVLLAVLDVMLQSVQRLIDL
jgi:hypothetical protein